MLIRVTDTSYVFKKVSYFIILREKALALKLLTVFIRRIRYAP